MKLFGQRNLKSSFAEFDTRQKSRRLEKTIITANASNRRSSYADMIAKPKGSLFAKELRGAQSFADFKRDAGGAKGLGLGKFFKRDGGWFSGSKK